MLGVINDIAHEMHLTFSQCFHAVDYQERKKEK